MDFIHIMWAWSIIGVLSALEHAVLLLNEGHKQFNHHAHYFTL